MTTEQKFKELVAEERKQADLYGYYEGSYDTARSYRKAKKRLDKAIAQLLAERDALAKLHEVATERTVQLAAVIEQANLVLHDTSLQIHMRNDEAATILAAADTDAALREVRAKTLEDEAARYRSREPQGGWSRSTAEPDEYQHEQWSEWQVTATDLEARAAEIREEANRG